MMRVLMKSMQEAVRLGFLTILVGGFWTNSVYGKTDGLFGKTTVFQQQTKKVSGVVTDANGEPLPGVNIIVKWRNTEKRRSFQTRNIRRYINLVI
ncbi:carboxypeptidase-like regulatory domain-containing protein [Capnocytophaga stomatis]|uniref:Carboxypeptidase-like regulatory domain-containing protein n=1 Tax=Capnocytophaga stomatis TaxID=1848904 RepID=A0ABW8QCI3_9FLAO|nr:carboxypeptidase-like regulatory domain-containing protein [Capnocytophaga stomatis]GIJ94775.1 hypothetical protein CAPN002_19930 [Capnocytophaga stomatis]GIM49991.1 hypothetical protein CAPN003_14430 [Capnocytophaga stomatis]